MTSLIRFKFRLTAVAAAYLLTSVAWAQTAPVSSSENAGVSASKVTVDTAKWEAATQLRSKSADAVASAVEKPAAVLLRLKAGSRLTGLDVEADADFAYGTVDIGERLIAAGKLPEAEAFFIEAEKTLDDLVRRTADQQAATKAQYLRKLAAIRVNYLDKPAAALASIDQAIVLQPEDGELKQIRNRLLSARADLGLQLNSGK